MQMPNTRIHLHSLFGSPIDGRTFSSEKYRFEFNGKEKDNEVKGAGNQQDYGARIYDPRLGRFLSADPLIVYGKEYANLSTYQFASNTPIIAVDLDGLEAKIRIAVQGADGKVSTIKVINWSQAFPGQSHGMFGNTGTINYTLQYQMRTKETRIETINIDYTTVKNGKPVELKATMDFEFRKRTFGEKVKHADDKLDPGKHGANGGGLGDEQDRNVALSTISLVVTGGVLLEAGTLVKLAQSILPIALDVDGLTTNTSGNTFVERKVLNNNPKYKAAYNVLQVLYGGVQRTGNLLEMAEKGPSAMKTIDHVNGSVNTATDAVSAGKSINEAKK